MMLHDKIICLTFDGSHNNNKMVIFDCNHNNKIVMTLMVHKIDIDI